MKRIIVLIVSLVVLCVLILAVNYVLFEMSAAEISQGTPIVRQETKREALLVIDIQEGITGKAATSDEFVVQSEELIRVVNRIIDASARRNVPVIYVKNEISNPLLNILNSSLARGEPGAELDSRLRIVSAYVINKDKGDAFSNPRLDSILIGNGVNRLVFTGLDLARCVSNTVEAAANRNYNICLVSDALISKDPDSLKQNLLRTFRARGFEVVSSEEYLQGHGL